MRNLNFKISLSRIVRAALFAGAFALSLSISAADVTSGLIIHYDFDAINGTTVPDISGNGNNGTLQGAATAVEGYSGQGVQCTVKADYISLPSGFPTNLTSFTYATWVKVSALKNATRFFDLGIGADATNNFLAFVPSYGADNGYMVLRYRPASGTAVNVTSTSKLPTGVWAHVALTYAWDATTSTGTAKMYLNGAVVATGTGLTYNPSLSLGAATENYLCYSRWTQDANGFGGAVDDVRFYNRALTADDVLTLNGLAELNKQYDLLTLGDLTSVKSNLTLPTVLGTGGVTCTWTSTKPSVVATDGTVTRPEKYNASVKLTALLSLISGGKENTMTKTFNVTVASINPTPEQIAEWTFETANISYEQDTLRVTDIQSGFKGKMVNDAKLRTIGTTTQYNVLDLGSGTGYFDMGKEIGEAIYSLNDFTMMGYFRIDETYTNLAANGNYYWNFSNSDKIGTDANGFMYGRLNATAAGISAAASPSTSASAGVAAAQGGWHHIAFTQQGTVGTVYIDGAQVAQNLTMPTPSEALAKDYLNGTLYNWLGRSSWTSDAYLQKTLLYDFQVLSFAAQATDLNFDLFSVPAVIEKLNTAYAENPDYKVPELTTELDNLNINISQVSSDIALPTAGTLDNTISISWKSSNSKLISNTGVVTRPDYFNYPVTLTATLMKNGQSTTKSFTGSVLAKDGSQFTGDLMAKWDFGTTVDSVVTDVAEKGFKGTLKNKARVYTIGETKKFWVLDLDTTSGYFDMGTDIGKVMYNLNDYTVSAYYRVNEAYAGLSSNGNFLFAFSNTPAAMTTQTGYVIGSLRDQSVSITPGYYTAASGNQAVSYGSAALTGGWHHFAYTQSGTVGTVYIDGMPMQLGDITTTPAVALAKEGQLGTLYNWIGRSNYTGDVYLKNTLVYDFRLYRKALTDTEIQNTVLNVGNTIADLDMAYLENPAAVNNPWNPKYTVITKNGIISVIGVVSSDKVSVTDISGRQMNYSAATNSAKVNTGIYIVKVNQYFTKVIVK